MQSINSPIFNPKLDQEVLKAKTYTIYVIHHKDHMNHPYTYVGQTSEPLNRRLTNHKSDSKAKLLRSELSSYVRNNGGWSCFTIEELDSITTSDKQLVNDLEDHYIR